MIFNLPLHFSVNAGIEVNQTTRVCDDGWTKVRIVSITGTETDPNLFAKNNSRYAGGLRRKSIRLEI